MEFDGTAWGQLFLFLTTISGFYFQYVREARHRVWEAEERIRQAAEVQRQLHRDASVLQEAVRTDADRLLAQNQETRVMLEENTEISRQAFHEANNVNQKIAAMGKRFDELLAHKDFDLQERSRIVEAVNEIPRLVQDMETTMKRIDPLESKDVSKQS